MQEGISHLLAKHYAVIHWAYVDMKSWNDRMRELWSAFSSTYIPPSFGKVFLSLQRQYPYPVEWNGKLSTVSKQSLWSVLIALLFPPPSAVLMAGVVSCDVESVSWVSSPIGKTRCCIWEMCTKGNPFPSCRTFLLCLRNQWTPTAVDTEQVTFFSTRKSPPVTDQKQLLSEGKCSD